MEVGNSSGIQWEEATVNRVAQIFLVDSSASQETHKAMYLVKILVHFWRARTGIHTPHTRAHTDKIHVQSSSVSQSCPTLCDPMERSTPGLPVHRQLSEFIQTHVHWVGDAIQPSRPLPSPSPPALYLSQQQGLFQGVSSSYQVAKILQF